MVNDLKPLAEVAVGTTMSSRLDYRGIAAHTHTLQIGAATSEASITGTYLWHLCKIA